MVGRVSHCPAPSELALPSISRGSAHLVRRRMNAHRDPPFTYKLVAITADNAHEAQPFTGAELVLLDGIVGVEIGPCDVLIMDGSRYHGVAPLRSLPGTQFKSQPLRHSLVHFTRSMHMEAPLGKRGRGTGGYWSEPEGGRTRLRTRVPVA